MAAEDILFQAFKAYEQLNKRAFVVTISTEYEFILSFKNANFKHLVGIQHLKDIEQSRFSADQVYRLVRSRTLTESMLRKSSFFSDISMRLLDFQHLPALFREGALVVHSFDKSKAGTMLKGDILIYDVDQYMTFLTLSCCRECVALADGRQVEFICARKLYTRANGSPCQGTTTRANHNAPRNSQGVRPPRSARGCLADYGRHHSMHIRSPESS